MKNTKNIWNLKKNLNNMKYYCEYISVRLAEKLEKKGMPYIDIDSDTFDEGTQYQRDETWCNNTYAEVFDWLKEPSTEL